MNKEKFFESVSIGSKIRLKKDLKSGVTYGNDVWINGMMKDCYAHVQGVNKELSIFFIEEGWDTYTPEMVECVVG